MALYHFHVTQVSRGDGQSAVASAAYRAGEKLYDTYYGETHDYTRKGGVILNEIILPDKAPERFKDRTTLWNEVEHVEKYPRAQLAYSFDFALQNELSREENIRIAREFIMENFVSRGMICDIAFHEPGKGSDDIPNPHVHVLVPMRPLPAHLSEQLAQYQARFTPEDTDEEAITAFLSETGEMFVCVQMLAYETLGYLQFERLKKSDSNRIAEIMHCMKDWGPAGIQCFTKYSRQRAWKRKQDATNAPGDGFMEIPEQMELPFD